jgi:GT2 family glycosyltransferase
MRDLVNRCMDALLATDYPDFEMIFVDDYSTDGSLEELSKLYGDDPRLKIIRNERNLGAAATRNAGILAASGELIALLDIDAKVHPRWLTELVDLLQTDPKVGAAQSKILSFDGKRIICAGEKLIPYLGWPLLVGSSEPDLRAYGNVSEILATTCSLVFRREVALRIGNFDSKLLHVQFEDLDFSWRMWLAGYKVVLAPNSLVHHEGSWRPFTLSKYKWVNYIVQRNFIRVFLKNYGTRNIAKYFAVSLGGASFRAVYHLTKKGDPYPIIGLLKASLWNLAFFRNTFAERNRIQRVVRRVPDSYFIDRISARISPARIYREFVSTGRV